MKRCPACGTENPMDAVYCASCGQSLQLPPPGIPIPPPIPPSVLPTPPLNQIPQSNSVMQPQMNTQAQPNGISPAVSIPAGGTPTNPTQPIAASVPMISGVSQDIPLPSSPESSQQSRIPSFQTTVPFQSVSQPPTTQFPQANTQPLGQQGNISYAGFWRQTGVYLIDGIILNIIVGLIRIPFSSQSSNLGLTFIITIILGCSYYTFFWVKQNGQTLGGKVLGVRIIKENGSSMTIGASSLRYIGFWVSSLILGLGYFWVIWDAKKQGWHDKIAGTVVIKV